MNANTNNAETEPSTRKRKRLYSLSDILFPVIVMLSAVVLLALFPDRATGTIAHSRNFLLEMLSILPAVVILMGLFSVFIPAPTVVRYLGNRSGLRGFFLALALGALPTGPLYVAFPLVNSLRQKGARTANLVAFLTAWASVKLPQEIVELRFLGPRFTVTRLILTITAAALMGIVTERVLRRWESEPSLEDA